MPYYDGTTLIGRQDILPLSKGFMDFNKDDSSFLWLATKALNMALITTEFGTENIASAINLYSDEI